MKTLDGGQGPGLGDRAVFLWKGILASRRPGKCQGLAPERRWLVPTAGVRLWGSSPRGPVVVEREALFRR